MTVKFLNWDSDFFNKKIGEILYTTKKELISIDGSYDLIYVKQKEKFDVEIDGFEKSYDEIKVLFVKEIKKRIQLKNNYVFSARDINFELEKVYELAYQSGVYSRFKLDNKFQEIEFKKLYRTWVDNSLSKEIADDILLISKDKTILGFATYKIFKEYAQIGLIAINPEYQGKGFGKMLMNSVENEALSKNIKILKVTTQSRNQLACEFYLKCGYFIEKKTIIKHFWKK